MVQNKKRSSYRSCTLHGSIWETSLEGWIQDRDGFQWTRCDLDYLSQCTLTVMEKKNKGPQGGGARSRRGNEYLTVTHGVKERNGSPLTSLCFSFLLSTPPPSQPPSSTLHLCSMPIEICKHNSLGNRIRRFM